jgi:ribose 5-phosphate isomerase A
MSAPDPKNDQKIEAAREALRSVRSGMSLGLGTGSTAKELVALLGDALSRGELRDIRCTCTSKQTEDQARSLGIPLFALAEIAPLDLAIDGADEIDAQLRLIKGRGGALVRRRSSSSRPGDSSSSPTSRRSSRGSAPAFCRWK